MLIDNHKLVCAGLRLLLERDAALTIIGEASDRASALIEMRAQPDVILLNLDYNDECGLDFLPELLNVAQGGRVLILTSILDPELHRRAVCLGAKGVVLKTDSVETFISAIKKVHAGEAWLHPATVAIVLDELIGQRDLQRTDGEITKIERITEREREVIALLGEGLQNKQIAKRLFISEATVRHHLTSIFDKIGVTDRMGLIIYAYQQGLAKLPVAPSNSKERAPEINNNGLNH